MQDLWQYGELLFDHVTMDHVLADLSQYYGVSFTVSDSLLYGCELKADFLHEPFDDVLETLRFSLHVQIEKTGDTWVISGAPCATQEQ